MAGLDILPEQVNNHEEEENDDQLSESNEVTVFIVLFAHLAFRVQQLSRLTRSWIRLFLSNVRGVFIFWATKRIWIGWNVCRSSAIWRPSKSFGRKFRLSTLGANLLTLVLLTVFVRLPLCHSVITVFSRTIFSRCGKSRRTNRADVWFSRYIIFNCFLISTLFNSVNLSLTFRRFNNYHF